MWWNTPLNLSFYAIAVFMSMVYFKHVGFGGVFVAILVAVLAYLGCLLLSDVLYYGCGVDVIDVNEVMRHQYNMSLAVDGCSGMKSGMDYGFNYYGGDFEKSPEQAQEDKFKYAYEQLGLKEGMRLLDCGCGCGDWLEWLQQRGIKVVGINVSEDQVKVCHSRGLDVVQIDWRRIKDSVQIQEKFFGQFDVMSFWDTVEHYVPMKWGMDRDKCKAVWTDMFQMATYALDPASPYKNVWISCLHISKNSTWYHSNTKYALAYFMDKLHSGMYPMEGELQDCAATQKMANIFDKDCTEDYYMTSVLCPEHFGRHKLQWTPKVFLVFFWNCFADPCWIHKFIWMFSEVWMKQFDGNDITNSMIKLHWLIFDAKDAACGPPQQ